MEKSVSRTSTFEWRLTGDRERVLLTIHSGVGRVSGQPAKEPTEEVVARGDVQRLLVNYDRDSPPAITPLHGMGAQGVIGRRDRRLREHPAVDLLLDFKVPAVGRSEAAGELQTWFRSATARRVTAPDGAEHVVLRFERLTAQPLYKTRTPDWIELWAAPALGFRVTRVLHHIPVQPEVWDVAANKTVRSAILVTREASEFTDYGGGVFIPRVVQVTNNVEATGTQQLLSEYRATVRSVNEALDDAEFDWTFPEHLHVFDYTVNAESPPEFLWGANDEPLMEIKSPRDLQQFAHLEQDQRPFPWWWVGGGAVLVLVVGYAAYRRRAA